MFFKSEIDKLRQSQITINKRLSELEKSFNELQEKQGGHKKFGLNIKQDSPESHARLIPVEKWPDFHTWPKVSRLRYWVFHEKANGFDKVVRRIGRSVLIDEDAFFRWLDEEGIKENRNV